MEKGEQTQNHPMLRCQQKFERRVHPYSDEGDGRDEVRDGKMQKRNCWKYFWLDARSHEES